MSYRRILLPDPPPFAGASPIPDIFEQGVTAAALRRVIVIGDGDPQSEHQSFSLLKALGLTNNVALQRVTRPQGGWLNNWLSILPLDTHRWIDTFVSTFLDLSSQTVMRLALSLLTKPLPPALPPPPPLDPKSPTLGPRTPENGHENVDDELSGSMGEDEFEPSLQSHHARHRGSDSTQRNWGMDGNVTADARAIAEAADAWLDSDGPLLVISSGPDCATVAAEVKRRAPNSTLVVQIQHPRHDFQAYDLIIACLHEFYALTSTGRREPSTLLLPRARIQPPAKNVVLTMGHLTTVDPASLRSAAASWKALARLPHPLVVVYIGAPTSNCWYGSRALLTLARQVRQMLPHAAASVRISFSQLTPPTVKAAISSELADVDDIVIDDSQDPGPHLGQLAWADAFVVTADNVEAISEACSTGKPVYVVGKEWCRGSLAEFHRTLAKRGATRAFTTGASVSTTWSYPPLTDNSDVARRVRAAAAAKGWTIEPHSRS